MPNPTSPLPPQPLLRRGGGGRHKRSKSTSDARSQSSGLSPTKSGRAAVQIHSSGSGGAHSPAVASPSSFSSANRPGTRGAMSTPSPPRPLTPRPASVSGPVPDDPDPPSLSDPSDPHSGLLTVPGAAALTRRAPTPVLTPTRPITRDKHRRSASFSSVARKSHTLSISRVARPPSAAASTSTAGPLSAGSSAAAAAAAILHASQSGGRLRPGTSGTSPILHPASTSDLSPTFHQGGWHDDEHDRHDHDDANSTGDGHAYYPVSSVPAQDWMTGGAIVRDGTALRDAFGRTLQMRGVNLCANSKLPSTPLADNPEHSQFFDHRNVTFVNRPFPLETAHEHFSRLKHWGLTFIRLLVTWEALEHSGPGQYDEEYIGYLVKLIDMMPKYGIKCFIDPHQDVWSRFSGGSGAPGWTFEVAGMDIRKFKETGAAHVHSAHTADFCDCTVDPVTGVYIQSESAKRTHGNTPYHPMLWPSNYTKLASANMFTLFFAGATFAPNRMVEGENIQHFLQRHYFAAYQYLASRVRDMEAVMGFEVMNEPHQGYIGLHDLTRFAPTEALLLGDGPSALESFALGLGLEQEIEVWVKSWPIPSRKESTRMVNSGGVRVWLPGYTDPWLEEGVFAVPEACEQGRVSGKPRIRLELLKKDYFTKHPKTGAKVDFNQDFYLPFITKYANAVHQEFPEAMILAEPLPQELPPVFTTQLNGLIYAPHWYDLPSVFAKAFSGFITHDVPMLRDSSLNIVAATYFGVAGARRNYANQLRRLKAKGVDRVGSVPCIIGECGIPMDINKRSAYDSGNYEHHDVFLDAVISAMEANLLHFTLWNYNVDNDNTHGDHWNGEDFSIFSPRQQVMYQLKMEDRRNRRKVKYQAGYGLPRSARSAPPLATLPSSTRPLLAPVATPSRAELVVGDGGASASESATETTQLLVHDKSVVPPTPPISSRRSKGKRGLLQIASHGRGSSSTGKGSSGSRDSSIYSPMTPNSPFDIGEVFFNDDLRHHMGGRVLSAVIRPYASRIAGTPTKMEFDLETLRFRLEFACHQVKLQRDPMTAAYFRWLTSETPPQCYETVVFVPKYHYMFDHLDVAVSDGAWAYYKEEQTLIWRIEDISPGTVHWLELNVRPDKPKARSTCGDLASKCSVM
ncbi:glycoside hydrolase superfamily [Blastocladiella britannica]|nr:glycoside hydrolase superfamily [Blastocladiella britannica]